MSHEAGEQTASDARDAFFQEVDVADPASVQAMYAATAERYGGIDVLYNNAGIMPADDASILDTEPDAYARVAQLPHGRDAGAEAEIRRRAVGDPGSALVEARDLG